MRIAEVSSCKDQICLFGRCIRMSDFHYLFILSSRAGDGRSVRLEDDIHDVFRRHHAADAEVVCTQSESDVYEKARTFAARFGHKAVIYGVGGDGSLNELVNAVYGSGAAVGLIPAGSGNDFSRMIYGPENFRFQDARGIIESSLDPRIEMIDLVRLSFEGGDEDKELVLVNVLSCGFDTYILRRAGQLIRRWPFLRGTAYFLAVVKGLFDKRRYDLEYKIETTDGQTLSKRQEAILLAVCNGGYYGNGFNPAPTADIQDGILQFSLVRALSFGRLCRLLPGYRKGGHTNAPETTYRDILRGEVISHEAEPLLANYDGNIFNFRHMRFEIMPKALPFVLAHPDADAASARSR